MGGLCAINWHAVRLYRVADALHRRGHGGLAMAVAAANRILTGVDIAVGARIGPELVIMHGQGIAIHPDAVVGTHCTLYQQVTIGSLRGQEPGESAPKLGDRVTVFAGAKVLGGIEVGDGATIGANSVVLIDVPPGCVAVGVPARILRRSSTQSDPTSAESAPGGPRSPGWARAKRSGDRNEACGTRDE